MADPKWLELARKEIGTVEIPGPRSNPKVVQYYMDVVKRSHADSVSWCAAFVGAMLSRAGEESTASLMAKSYLRYGKPVAAQTGAIAVWTRGNPKGPFGHVNFIESVAGDKLVCIGGNQSDAVNRRVYSKRKAIAFTWPTDRRTI